MLQATADSFADHLMRLVVTGLGLIKNPPLPGLADAVAAARFQTSEVRKLPGTVCSSHKNAGLTPIPVPGTVELRRCLTRKDLSLRAYGVSE